MLIQIISQYLKANKRLVVPQLGAFIVKVPNESIVFSELLRADDGVLRGLLCAGGMNELEAAGVIDRFVFEVRHGVQSGGDFPMPGFGNLYAGPNGTVAFTYLPVTEIVADSGRQAATPAATPPDAMASPRADEALLLDVKTSVSSKMNPEPYVKGLRYGKPEKTTGAYRYVDRAPRRQGFDKLLLFAIIAAVLALATIAYVYIRESRPEQLNFDQTELLIPAADDASASDVPQQPEIPQP